MERAARPSAGRQSVLRPVLAALLAVSFGASALAAPPEELTPQTPTDWTLTPAPNTAPTVLDGFPSPVQNQGSSQGGAADYDAALADYEAGQYASALMRAKASGDAGDMRGALLAGYLMKTGLSGRKDYRSAAQYYEIAARAGDSDAMVALGEMGAMRQGGLGGKDAKDWLTQAAKLGRTDAIMALAEIEIKGVDIPVNRNAGRDWLIVAMDKGEARAARKLGDLYIDQEPRTALSYYEKAADLGDGEAAYIAAVMYAENLSIRPDEARAAMLMDKAAKAGVPGAMADYGLLVFQGLAERSAPSETRASRAAQWFEKAAKAGDDQGKFFWAYALAKGDGTQQSLEEAYFWILQTRSSGIAAYDKDIATLREALEAQADPASLARARSRAGL